MNYFIRAMQNYADFSGRTRRDEFWLFTLLQLSLLLLFYSMDMVLTILFEYDNNILSYSYIIGMFIPTISMAVRRFHDTGRSGVKCLIVFIPFMGWCYLLYVLCSKGDFNANAYGVSPQYKP
jgi:uncharacterized membrane protein YhaH (DUF805 family)